MLSSISLQYLRGTQKISLTCREFKDTISNEKKGREKEIDPVNEIVISGGTMENRRVRAALSATALIPAMAGNESPQFVRLKLSRHYAREFLLTFLSSTPSPPPSKLGTRFGPACFPRYFILGTRWREALCVAACPFVACICTRRVLPAFCPPKEGMRTIF